MHLQWLFEGEKVLAAYQGYPGIERQKMLKKLDGHETRWTRLVHFHWIMFKVYTWISIWKETWK